jgi:hypothetical protein
MDSHRFDALTRRLTTVLNRRTSLGMAASLGLLGLGLPDEAAGKRNKSKGKVKANKKNKGKGKGKKKPCPPCKGRKKGKCTKTLSDGAACDGGACQAGSCIPTSTPPLATTTTTAAPQCTPESTAVTCAGRCGSWLNNCDQAVTCACPGGQACLSNGSCARVCTAGSCPGTCAGCSKPTTDGSNVCLANGTCAGKPPCESSGDCDFGHACILACDVKACYPLCGV